MSLWCYLIHFDFFNKLQNQSINQSMRTPPLVHRRWVVQPLLLSGATLTEVISSTRTCRRLARRAGPTLAPNQCPFVAPCATTRWRLLSRTKRAFATCSSRSTALRGDDGCQQLRLKLTSTYHTLRPSGRLGFISVLAQFGVRDADVQRCADNLVHARSREPVPRLQAQLSLREALVPRHEQVAQRIAQQPGGLSFLVTMRADLLSALAGTLVDDSGTASRGAGSGSEQPDEHARTCEAQTSCVATACGRRPARSARAALVDAAALLERSSPRR